MVKRKQHSGIFLHNEMAISAAGISPMCDHSSMPRQKIFFLRSIADLGNPHLHRRARLAAGRVLGAVGDPRLTPQVIHSVQVILPDLVSVPGGTATIGSA